MTIDGNCTINMGSQTLGGTLTSSIGVTVTLTSSLTINNLTLAASFTFNKTASETLTISGTMTSSTGVLNGTAKTILTGNWTGSGTPGATAGVFSDMDIQGNVTITGNVRYQTGTLRYVSGTVTASSATLLLRLAATFDTNGMSWGNVTQDALSGVTYTFSSQFNVSGTFTLTTLGNVTFAGTSGFSVGTLTTTITSAQTITLQNSVTYIVNSLLNCNLSQTSSIVLFTSNDATLKAKLTLTKGASCNCLASFTRIDASGGRPIRTFGGTLTSTVNIFIYTDLPTYAG